MMPETSRRSLPPVSTTVFVSPPTTHVVNKGGQTAVTARTRAGVPSSISEEHDRSTSEWLDVDEAPSRRKRSTKRSSQQKSPKLSSGSQTGHRNTESELGRFFPKLSRILETAESTNGSRTTRKGLDHRPHRDRGSAGRHRYRNEASPSSLRSVKQRTGAIQRRTEIYQKLNPSLLSVLSSFTGSSGWSSGSSSTLTQQTYDQRSADRSQTSKAGPRRSKIEFETRMASRARAKSTNVFDYMTAPAADDAQDSRSVASSSSSSHYEPSDAGSSEAPGTPSSGSTLPSPTATRNSSVAELRRKYDAQRTTSNGSVRSNSSSPVTFCRSPTRLPTVADVPECEVPGLAPRRTSSSIDSSYRPRSSSRSSRSPQHSVDRLNQQEETMRQHMAYTSHPSQGYYVEPVHGQHRSSSAGSAHSDAHVMAMQQYQWPPAPGAELTHAVPPQAMNGHVAPPNQRPPAPDAPDLSQRTIAGYELLARELTSSSSPVNPLYRKFSYLNHRLLLHLQDELSELEEQLRTLDEIIAQMAGSSPGHHHPQHPQGSKTPSPLPSSRRAESYHGTEIHWQRTQLLGRIFLKTEQYNRALSAFTTMERDSSRASEEQVSAYKHWLTEHSPIHEVETRFLNHPSDLLAPRCKGRPDPADDSIPRPSAILASVASILVLSVIIPGSLAGRLLISGLFLAITVLFFLFVAPAAPTATSTANANASLRNAFALGDWRLWGAGCALLITVVFAGGVEWGMGYAST